MEDPRQVNQEKSELDISCCLSSKFMLPSSLFEDDDEEINHHDYEISLKRNFNSPLKKYSSSTEISVGSNNSSHLVNRNLVMNEVPNLNRNVPNLIRNDMRNQNNFRVNPDELEQFQKKSLQKLKTFSHVQRRDSENFENNFANSTFYSPQMYPSNYQDMIYNNMISNKINNINFQNLFNNGNNNNHLIKIEQFPTDSRNFTQNPGFTEFSKNTLDLIEINRNNFRVQPNFSNGVSIGQLNPNFPEATENFNNKAPNALKNNFTKFCNNNKNNSVTPQINLGLPLFSASEPKRNSGYDFVYEMAKMNISNKKSIQNRKTDMNRKQSQTQTQTKMNPYTIQNSKQENELVDTPKCLTQSLTPVFLPRKINTQEVLKKNNLRRLNSHTSRPNIISDTIMEEPTENDIPAYDGSLHNFLKTIDGNLVPYLKTQKGSRAMQKFMNTKLTPECVDMLFLKIYSDTKELMTDNYGNYFMQKLIQLCSSNQKMLLLKIVI
jgi:hypothetical protein